MGKDFPIKTTIKADDKASPALRKISATAKNKLSPAFRQAAKEAKALKRGLAFGGKIKSFVMAAAVPAAVLTAAAYGVNRLVQNYAALVDEQSKLARQTGVNIENLQELEHVGSVVGVPFELLQKSLKKFTRQLGDAKTQTGTLYTLLGKTNPDFLEQITSTDDTDDALALILNGLKKIKDPAKRASLAVAAFGGAGMDMIRIADLEAKALKDLRQEARDLGIVVSQEAADDVEKFNDDLNRLSKATTGVSNKISQSLIPAIDPLVVELGNWVQANRDLLATSIADTILNVATGLKDISGADLNKAVTAFGEMAQTTADISRHMKDFVDILKLLPDPSGPFKFLYREFAEFSVALDSANSIKEFDKIQQRQKKMRNLGLDPLQMAELEMREKIDKELRSPEFELTTRHQAAREMTSAPADRAQPRGLVRTGPLEFKSKASPAGSAPSPATAKMEITVSSDGGATVKNIKTKAKNMDVSVNRGQRPMTMGR